MSETLLYLAAVSFEAACRIPILPIGHRSRRQHGHSFLARVRSAVPGARAGFPGGEVLALRHALEECIAPLDYQDLNAHLSVPTDENLARWVRSRLDLPGVASVGIQSTADQGADLDGEDHVHLWRRFRFEAAHQLPNVPSGHQCGRMHGHGFEVILHVDQDLSERDMGLDFDVLGSLWEPIRRQVDYACLNDIPGLENPTSEMLAGWIWDRLRAQLPELSWVTVYETHTAGCHFDGRHYRIWKENRFESAVRLQRAPNGDPRRRLHGHSYVVRLHLTAPLDTVMGWTVDYGDVKERFTPLYRELDHQALNLQPQLDDADVATLAFWIRERMCQRLPQLDRIDLYETPGCGALLSWGELGPALP